MSDELIHLELHDGHQSVDNGGNLEPLNNIGLTVPMPTETALGTMMEQVTVRISPADTLTDELHVRIIPRTRMVETRLPLLAEILESAGFVRIDEPDSTKIKSAEDETTKHEQYIEEFAAEVAKGEAPAPDVDDNPGAEPPPVAPTQAALQARGRPKAEKAASSTGETPSSPSTPPSEA